MREGLHLPTDKADVANAQRFVQLDHDVGLAHLADVVAWLRDSNWPVAAILAPYVAAIGVRAAPVLRPVLSGDDEQWKYCVLTRVLPAAPTLTEALRGELLRIAKAPTIAERAEGLDALAAELLEAW